MTFGSLFADEQALAEARLLQYLPNPNKFPETKKGPDAATPDPGGETSPK